MLFLLLYIFVQMEQTPAKEKSILCLGDSYTIGQSVETEERFPEQTVSLLAQQNINFEKPEIIAKTGWTTRDLITAIDQKNISKTYNCVTVLIGVNDQFRGVDTSIYRKNFEVLLQKAIFCADKDSKSVFVLSIPDYGVTPFARTGRQTPSEISKEIADFNVINRAISIEYGVHYLDITNDSKLAEFDLSLLASDQLHPSGKMYSLWAQKLNEAIQLSYK